MGMAVRDDQGVRAPRMELKPRPDEGVDSFSERPLGEVSGMTGVDQEGPLIPKEQENEWTFRARLEALANHHGVLVQRMDLESWLVGVGAVVPRRI